MKAAIPQNLRARQPRMAKFMKLSPEPQSGIIVRVGRDPDPGSSTSTQNCSLNGTERPANEPGFHLSFRLKSCCLIVRCSAIIMAMRKLQPLSSCHSRALEMNVS